MSWKTQEIERLICSAIWYKDDVKHDNCNASLTGDYHDATGIVFCGLRHADCFGVLWLTIPNFKQKPGNPVQGFLTNRNRFVDRKEAAQIALATGQVKAEELGNYTDLFSEHVW